MFAAIITPEMTVRFVKDRPEGIAWLQDAVGGRFDVVAAPHADVWVNDEGLLEGLPLNLVASAIALTPLVGPAVVTGPVDSDGETTPILPRLVELLRRDLVEV
jgi:hypothetical protein